MVYPGSIPGIGHFFASPSPRLSHFLIHFRRGGVLPRPWEGKSAKRRQWRMKRAGFEEVPRLAGTTVPVSRLARRWAREPLPYAPQGTHRAGRTGADDPTVGTDSHVASLLGMTGFFRCHCEPVTDVTGVAIRNTPYAAATFPAHKPPPEAAASGGGSIYTFNFLFRMPPGRSVPPGTAPAPGAHTHTGPRCTTGRPGSCGCRC